MTEILIKALREPLIREEGRQAPFQLKDELLEISKRCASLPDLDKRCSDEILEYDKHGLPRS